MQNSYAPYSRFKVGAALLSKGGKVYVAGYVDNASSGAGICVNRVTIAKAISDGERMFEAQVLVGDSPAGAGRALRDDGRRAGAGGS